MTPSGRHRFPQFGLWPLAVLLSLAGGQFAAADPNRPADAAGQNFDVGMGHWLSAVRHRFKLRLGAEEKLRKLGLFQKAFVPNFARDLRDQDPTRREAAAFALGLLGPTAKAAAPDLVVATDDGIHSVQEAAISALGRIGASGGDVTSAIVAAAAKRPALRRNAVYALAEMDAPDSAAVEFLVDSLSANDGIFCWAAVTALGRIGPRADAALEPLKALFDDKNPEVQGARCWQYGGSIKATRYWLD